MTGPDRHAFPESSPKSGATGKVKVAYIGAAGVIVAAIISGLFLYLSQSHDKNGQIAATSDNRVVVNMPPAVTQPATPAFHPFQGSVFHLPLGRCANIFSEPYILSQDLVGSLCAGTTVYIYCTVETVAVGDSSVWDLIYFKTNWGTGGYIPDYYVDTGTSNAVEPSCST